MNETPTLEQIEYDMRPGRCSNGGFLGMDESLKGVIAQDEQTLARFGISCEQIAGSMERLWSAAQSQKAVLSVDDLRKRGTDFPCLHKPETIPTFSPGKLPGPDQGFMIGDHQVFIVQYRGFQTCPWYCPDLGSSDFMILNRRTGQSFAAPELIIHLIRVHRFFEGFQSPYRVDPERVIRTLDLCAPGS